MQSDFALHQLFCLLLDFVTVYVVHKQLLRQKVALQIVLGYQPNTEWTACVGSIVHRDGNGYLAVTVYRELFGKGFIKGAPFF